MYNMLKYSPKTTTGIYYGFRKDFELILLSLSLCLFKAGTGFQEDHRGSPKFVWVEAVWYWKWENGKISRGNWKIKTKLDSTKWRWSDCFSIHLPYKVNINIQACGDFMMGIKDLTKLNIIFLLVFSLSYFRLPVESS